MSDYTTRVGKSCCPYCGETVSLVLDPELEAEPYTEDCEVCCRPMVVSFSFTSGETVLNLRREDDA